MKKKKEKSANMELPHVFCGPFFFFEEIPSVRVFSVDVSPTEIVFELIHIYNISVWMIGWVQNQQKEHVRWSCVDKCRGCQTLELNAEVSGVVIVSV